MSNQEPDGPYVYQPHATTNNLYSACGRLWAVGGVGVFGLTVIDGLTKEEANVIAKALRELPR